MTDLPYTPPADIHNTGYGAVDFGGDAHLRVRFFRGKEYHSFKKEWVGVDMVEIRQPGERDVLHRAVTEEHKMRFPRQWAAYQEGREQTVDGTPIEVLFEGHPEVLANLRMHGITVVEQLANATETALGRLGMGARQHKAKAEAFLEARGGSHGIRQLQSELEGRDARIAALEAKIEALLSATQEQQPRRGPGRPPKVAADE